MNLYRLPQECRNLLIYRHYKTSKAVFLWGLILKNDSIEFLSAKENPEKSQLSRPYAGETDGVCDQGRRQGRYSHAKVQASFLEEGTSAALEKRSYPDTPGRNRFCYLVTDKWDKKCERTLRPSAGRSS